VEFGADFNSSNNALIKLAELFLWNPIFEMQSSAHFLYGKLRKVACLYSESGDISNFRLGVFRIPVARYLSGVFFVNPGCVGSMTIKYFFMISIPPGSNLPQSFDQHIFGYAVPQADPRQVVI
jgi:hypothetical protein